MKAQARRHKAGKQPSGKQANPRTIVDEGVEGLVDHGAPGQVRHGLELVVDVQL